MTILNLTQHPTSPQQVEAGVVEPDNKPHVKQLLTFDSLPSPGQVKNRAQQLALAAARSGHRTAMIGGAPYLMASLEKALLANGITPVYAFSERRSKEVTDPKTGEVRKVNTFIHLGFVSPTDAK